MKVKVCGLRRPDDMAALASIGADYLGLVLYPHSPRYAPSSALSTWIATAPEALREVSLVGVFVNAEIEEVLNAVHDYRLDVAQLHGDESPDYCRELHAFRSLSYLRHLRLVKAFRVDAQFDFAQAATFAPFCEAVLFDTRADQYGGTGQSFDWTLLERYRGPLPFWLSGGIGPEHVLAVKQLQHPWLWGVDLNSRFETAPGEKDVALIEQFINDLRTP